jgi:hypothetical protein
LVLSVLSLVLAFLAVTVNASGIVRRPRVIARWGAVYDQPFREGLSIIITARRRSIQVDEIGFVKLDRPSRWLVNVRGREYCLPVARRQFPEWHREDRPVRVVLGPDSDPPVRLQDGESTRVYIDLDAAIDDLEPRTKFMYAYVKASGTVYLAREKTNHSDY